jgi:hypothetical protein
VTALPSGQDVPVSWSAPDFRRPVGAPAPAAAVQAAPPRWWYDALASLSAGAFSVLLGAPLGLLWSALAPHAHVSIDAAAGASIVDGATEVFIGADGWFLAVTLVAGLLCGTVTWFLARRSAPYVLIGLVGGGLLAAYVASKVGVQLGQDDLRAAIATGTKGNYTANVVLQMKVAIVVWPLGALVAFVVLVLSRVDEID